MDTCLRLWWTAILFGAALCAQSPLANPGFEEGKPGETPPGWRAGNRAAYPARIVSEFCNSGKQCAVLESAGPAAPENFGTLLQSFDATPYRGKKFRYRAAVRTDQKAQLWLRVDLEDNSMGFFDNMGSRPITSTSWRYYEIAGEIDRGAKAIFLGLLLPGAGKAWIDDVSFVIAGDADPIEAPRPLTSRGLQNLRAFARLFGYLRYFHPTDAAAAADWNHVAVEGVRYVEPAQTPAELAAKLESFFHPVALSVRIFPTGSPAPPLEVTPLPFVMFWQHRGVGMNPQSLYLSARVTKPVSEAAEALQPFRADLPGGVTCLLPIALYRNSPGMPSVAPTAAKPSGSPDDRATRLAAVIIAWNVFQHFYPYFDVLHTDWPAVLPNALSQAASQDAAGFVITLRRLVAALHDGHGGVFGPRVPADFVPPVIWTWAENRIVALAVKGAVGIAPGDAIRLIDGKPAAEVLAAKEALISGATPQFIRYSALASLLGRRRDEPVHLEIESAGKPPALRSVTLRCTAMPSQLEEPRPEKVKELEPGIFYLDLARITDADYAEARPSLEKAKGIIFDMRGYPRLQNAVAFFGHLIDSPATSAQWHVPLVNRPDREGMTFIRQGEWQLQPIAPYFKAKRAFLTDGRAISYAESCLGIVEHYKLAEIAGEPTAGTNGNTNPFTVPGGYTINWTGMKVLKHDGSQHHGVGIQPTLRVSRTRAGIAAGRDEILDRAVQVVKQ